MKAKTVLSLFLPALFLPIGQASAQPASAQVSASAATPQTKVEPAKEAAIRQFLELSNTKNNFLDMMHVTSKSVASQMTAILPPGDYRQKLVDIVYAKFEAKMTADIENLVDAAIPVYDKHFSLEEIEFLVKFSETAAARKNIAVVPQAFGDSLEQGIKEAGVFRRNFIKKTLADDPKMAEGFGLKVKPDQQKPSILPADAGIAPARIDAAKEAKIRHLVDISGAMKTMPVITQALIQEIRNNPSLFADTKYRAHLTDLYVAYLSDNMGDYALATAISLYDKYFSSAEIQELIDFFETPTGKKITDDAPQLLQELGSEGQKWGIQLWQLCFQEVLVENPDLAEAFEKAVNGAPPK